MNYSNDDILALHKKYAPSDAVFQLVLTHSQIVYDIALQLLQQLNLDLDHDVVRIGTLVHDIGVHRLLDMNGALLAGKHYITHGVEGEQILKAEGFPEVIWRFASHHTGVGLTKHDITEQNLPLPSADYLAETPEEELIMYADKFHSKTTPPYFNSYEWYRNDIAKFGDDKVATFERMAQKFGIPDLQPLSQRYGFLIR